MEKRLVATYLSKKPLPGALAMTMVMILSCTFFSLLYWNTDYASYLAANLSLVKEDHQWWRLFTTTFVHGDLKHLLSNSYMLAILSFFVFGYFRFAVYPISALVLAAVTNWLTLISMPDQVYLIGASGMVYWLAGFWLTIYIFIERQRSYLQRIVRSFGVALMTLFPSTLEPQVSYKAHAVGFGLGVLYAIGYFVLNKNKIRQSENYKIIYDEEDEFIPETSSFY